MDLAIPPKLQQEILNKRWRLENLYPILDKQKRVSLLRFNNIQNLIWNDVKDHLDTFGHILKPINHLQVKYRQGGVSTFWLLFWLDDTIFNSNVKTGIMADSREGLGYLFEIIRFAHANMKPEYRPKLGEDSKTTLSFPEINSKITVSLAFKSTALHNLHISEWAYADQASISMSLAACGPTANITGESTGNGMNHLYDTFQEARRGESPFKARFTPWFVQTEYRIPLNGVDPQSIMNNLIPDERKLQALMKKDYGLELDAEQVFFRRDMVKKHKGLFREKFPETVDDAFLTSGNKFFEPKKIHRLLLEAKDWVSENPPVEDPQGDWTQWELPNKDHLYVGGADTSEGSHDYSYLKIFCVTCRNEAFRFRARCGIDVFYRNCDRWGREYNKCLIAVERNNTGHAVLLGLNDVCHYPNIYKEQSVRHSVNVQHGSQGGRSETSEPKLGWLTNSTTKEPMLEDFRYALEGDSSEDEDHFEPELLWLDQILLAECMVFERNEGRLEAIEGKHDDGVMATGIAFQMYKKMKRHARPVDSPTQGHDFGIFVAQPRMALENGFREWEIV